MTLTISFRVASTGSKLEGDGMTLLTYQELYQTNNFYSDMLRARKRARKPVTQYLWQDRMVVTTRGKRSRRRERGEGLEQ